MLFENILLPPTEDTLNIYIDDLDTFIQNYNIQPPDTSFYYYAKKHHIIYLEKWDEYILIHEISHTIDNLFKIKGFNDTELRAYYMAWLYKTIRRLYELHQMQ